MRDRRVAVVVLLALLLAALPQSALAAPPRAASAAQQRLMGATRYDTAVAASVRSFPGGAPAVVLVAGGDSAGAQLAMSLAGAVGGPVLLTNPASTSLPPAVSAEIFRLHPAEIVVVGPTSAVSDAVAQQAAAIVPCIWNRVAPNVKTTFQLADEIAKEVANRLNATPPDGAFLVYGGMGDWTSLAALAPYAYSRKMPILLSWFSHVSTEAIDAISCIGLDHIVVANSEYYQSAAVVQQLADRGVTTERVREVGRLGLATAMAQHAVDRGWATYENVVVGSSVAWSEDLTVGEYAGVKQGVFMFTDPTSVPFETNKALYDHSSDISTVTIMGSPTVVSVPAATALANPSAPATGAIAGTVTAQTNGAALGGIHVTAWGWDPTSVASTVFFSGEATTAADGSYTIPGLEGRRYYVRYEDPSGTHVDESYKHAPSEPGCGDQVVVTAGGPAAVASTSLFDQAGWKSQLVSRVSGPDRYQTAIEISKRNFQSADTAVLVTGNGFADALSASSLCGAYQAPLLLVRYGGVPDGLVAELNRLGVKSVFIVGSDKVVSNAVVTALARNGIGLRERIGGANRFATSAAVYEHLKSHGFGVPSDPFIARGDDFPDALAAAPAAYVGLRPILLVNPTTVPAEIGTLFGKYQIGEVNVMGSENAVSRGVLQQLAGANGLHVVYYYRFQGANRYATAADFVSRWYGTPVFAGVATGLNFPDALSGGVLAGSRGGALLLTTPTTLHDSAKAVLKASASRLWAVRILGGSNVVGNAAASSVAQTLNAPGVMSALPDGPVVEPGPKGAPEAVYAR